MAGKAGSLQQDNLAVSGGMNRRLIGGKGTAKIEGRLWAKYA